MHFCRYAQYHMMNRFKAFAVVVFPLAGVAGFLCSFIKWGNVSGFHGEGFPVPTVMWDNAYRYPGHSHLPEDHMIDFPNSFGIPLNILVFLIAGVVLFFIAEMCRFTLNRLRMERQ